MVQRNRSAVNSSMKEQLIALIIKDRARVLTLGTGFVLAIIGALLTRFAGIELDKDTELFITALVTLAIGYAFDGWALDQTAKGGKAIQERLQQVNPEVVVDGVIGPVTIGATEDLLAATVVATAQTSTTPTTSPEP